MRTYPIVLALLLAGSTAFAAQKRPTNSLAEFQTGDFGSVAGSKARKRPGVDLAGYGAKEAVKEKPYPWKALGLAALVMLFSLPFGFRMYRSTRKDLEDQATFGLKGSAHEREAKGDKAAKRPPSRKRADAKPSGQQQAGGAVADARDAVWGAISGADDWVAADWVASSAGIPVSQASGELATLVEEGYVEETRDRANKPVYRLAS